MTGCTLELPYPPPLSACFTNAPRRGRVKSKRYHAWLAHAQAVTVGKRRMIEGRVHVNITARPPDKRKRDLDNLPKPILDWATGRVIVDDSFVESLFLCWDRNGGEPGVRVEVIPAC